MRISVTSTQVTVGEIDNLRALDALVSLDMAGPDLDVALGDLGSAQDDNLWLDVEALRRRGRPDDPAWCEAFVAMIAFAAGSGWTSEDQKQVRCHMQRCTAAAATTQEGD